VGLEKKGDFDLARLKIPSGDAEYPSDYGGVSGGGIWISRFTLLHSMEIESLAAEPVFLAGMAFCQSAKDGDGYHAIIGHGPSSISDQISAL
jgi:hypothetical protein